MKHLRAISVPPAVRALLTPPLLSSVVCAAALSVYFFGFIYPAALANEQARAQAAGIPELTKRIAAVRRRVHHTAESAAALRRSGLSVLHGLRGEAPLRRVHRDLSRLARRHGLSVVGMDGAGAWRPAERPPGPLFLHAQTVWKLKGGYFNYLAFKRALASYRPVIVHVAGERLMRDTGGNDNAGLSADVRLSFYRFNGMEEGAEEGKQEGMQEGMEDGAQEAAKESAQERAEQ